MPTTCFSIDGITFPHLRVLNLEQTFEILDADNSGRVKTGEMKRDIIGTYYNYKLKLKPELSNEGMSDYSKLWYMCSNPVEQHVLIMPYDVGSNGEVSTTLTFNAYITAGKREMLKYAYDDVDYWKEGEFQFVAMAPQLTPVEEEEE